MHVCAWCSRGIGILPGKLFGRPTRNYGICPECLRKCLASLSSLPTNESRQKKAAQHSVRAAA
jgi:hypothetical protein